MAYRTLELTLISANDLRHATFISKMEVYAISSIDGYPSSQQRTAADREGGTSPVWDTTLRFSIPSGDPSNHFLHVLLRCHRAFGVRDIGEVRIPLKELLNCFAEGRGDRQFVSYQIQKNSSSKVGGVLNLSYKLLDVAPLKTDEPVTAYPYAAEPRMGATYPAAGGDVAPLRADEPATAYPYAAEPREGATYPPAGGDVAPLRVYEPVTAYPYENESRMDTTYPPAGGGVAPLRADEPVTAYPYADEPRMDATYPPAGGDAAPLRADERFRMGATYPPVGGDPPYAQPYPALAGNGYPAPAPVGYDYPQVGYGHGATPPASARPARNNRFGMGTGLLGGALGGLLIGDMLSDNNSGYEGGGGDRASDYSTVYDGGNGDGGGYDEVGGFDF